VLTGFAPDVHAQSATIKQFDNWTSGCIQSGRCYAMANVAGARIIFARDPDDDRIYASIVVSPDSEIGQPITLRLDTNVAMQLEITGCTDLLCEAVIGEDKVPIVLTHFETAEEGVVAYLSGGKIAVAMVSLDGFDDAVAACCRIED
jgi:hypothetical protein